MIEPSINPRFSSRWGILYIDRAKVYATQNGVAYKDITGETNLPIDQLNAIMLGPGTSITHKSIERIATKNCVVIWCGTYGVKFCAAGNPSFCGKNIARQALAYAHIPTRTIVAQRMFAKRFTDPIKPNTSIASLRGMEGYRMRKIYEKTSLALGLPIGNRVTDWNTANNANKAYSVANACLYSICYAAIAAFGLSPALGFVHCGHSRSFVFDIADLYKTDLSLPTALNFVKDNPLKPPDLVRHEMQKAFTSQFLTKIIDDMQDVLGFQLDTKNRLGYETYGDK